MVESVKQAVFLDLDNTIVSVGTEQSFIKHLVINSKLNPVEFIQALLICYKYHLNLTSDYNSSKRDIINKITKNKNCIEYWEIFDAYFNKTLKKYIYPDMLEVIDYHKKNDREIYIISSSLDFIARKFAEYLNVKYVATLLEAADNCFTGNIIDYIYFEEQKAKKIEEIAIQENIDLSLSYAYGDHFADRFMLGTVGHPVAVNPDKKLLKLAKSKQWQIMRCELKK